MNRDIKKQKQHLWCTNLSDSSNCQLCSWNWSSRFSPTHLDLSQAGMKWQQVL